MLALAKLPALPLSTTRTHTNGISRKALGNLHASYLQQLKVLTRNGVADAIAPQNRQISRVDM